MLGEIALYQHIILCQVKLNLIKKHLEISVTELVFNFVLVFMMIKRTKPGEQMNHNKRKKEKK